MIDVTAVKSHIQYLGGDQDSTVVRDSPAPSVLRIRESLFRRARFVTRELEPSGSSDLRIYFKLAESGRSEYVAEVIAFSTTSFLMSSPVNLSLGTKLHLRMRVPIEISGSPFVELRTDGRVVAFTPSSGGGYYDVKVEANLHSSVVARFDPTTVC